MALYTALRVRPFDFNPEEEDRTEEELAAVRLGASYDELKPGATRVSYVGEDLTAMGSVSGLVNSAWWSARHWEKFPLVNEEDGEWCDAQPIAEQTECFDWCVARGALEVLLGEHRKKGTTFDHDDAAWGEAKDVILISHTVAHTGGEMTAFGPNPSAEPWTDSNMGIFPRLVQSLLATSSATHTLTMKVFQQVEVHIWDLLGDQADDVGESVHPLNPRLLSDSLDVVPGTLKTKEICWLEGVVLDTWDTFVDAYSSALENMQTTPTTYNRAALNGHVYYEIEVKCNTTGYTHSLFAVRLSADPLPHDVELVRSDATLKGYGVTRDSASAAYEREHPGDIKTYRRRALQNIASTHDLGDLLESFVKATHQKNALAGGRTWAGKNIRQRYAHFPARFLKERVFHSLTLVVGAIRPEAETHTEMCNTLKFFQRFFPRPRDQYIGSFPSDDQGGAAAPAPAPAPGGE